MILNEAIRHCIKKAEELDKIKCTACADEHRQLKKWLQELNNIRSITQDYINNEIDAEQAMTIIVSLVDKGKEDEK